MKRYTTILIIALLLICLTSGCIKKTERPDIQTPDREYTPPQQPTADDTITDEVSTEISDIDTINNDLEDADLENLEDDFANIDW